MNDWGTAIVVDPRLIESLRLDVAKMKRARRRLSACLLLSGAITAVTLPSLWAAAVSCATRHGVPRQHPYALAPEPWHACQIRTRARHTGLVPHGGCGGVQLEQRDARRVARCSILLGLPALERLGGGVAIGPHRVVSVMP